MREADTDDDGENPPRQATGHQACRSVSRRDLLASIGSVGVLGLAGCSLPSGASSVDPLWERDFAAASAAGPPAATATHVLVGGQDKQLRGFTATGEEILAVETGGPIEAQPAVPASGGPVHVHSTDGDLYTVGLSGEQRWHVDGQARDGWLGRHGSLLVGIDPVDGVVTGYDAHDGTRRFQRAGREYPSPTLSDAACLFPVTNSAGETRLVVLAPETGELLWESPAGDGYPHVVAAEDRVATVRNSTVRLRRAADGQVLWQTPLDGEVTSHGRPPLWLGEAVYVRVGRDDATDELIALSRTDGTVQWQQSVGTELEAVTATPAGVFVASSVNDPDGGIFIRLDAFALDGTRRWHTTTDVAIGGVVETLARVGEVVVAGSENELAAYDHASGTRRWQYDPTAYRIAATATDDELYVSYRDEGGLARLPTS